METLVALLQANASHAALFEDRFAGLQVGQRPQAVTVCCADSRVLQDHIWGNDDPGRLFTCGNIGNRVVQQTAAGRVVSGDVLYPIVHAGTDTIIVVGHTGCGAVTATYDFLTDGLDEPPGIRHCISLLEPSISGGVALLPSDLDRAEAINHLVEYNVDQQIRFLRESEEIPSSVDLVGVVYDFQDVYDGHRGEVHVINIGGKRTVDSLHRAHPAIEPWIQRLWEYET